LAGGYFSNAGVVFETSKEEVMTNKYADRLVVVEVTHDVAKVWAVRESSQTHPDVILREPDSEKQNHFKQASRNNNHGVERIDGHYFEEIVNFLLEAKKILLVGNGKGKASEMELFADYLTKKHRNVADKVVGHLSVNVKAMTDAEVVDAAKAWFDQPIHAS
jgi:DNA-binding MurR/RpiR family transcriptional regulator